MEQQAECVQNIVLVGDENEVSVASLLHTIRFFVGWDLLVPEVRSG